MSDVHGRKREKTTEELIKAKKDREAGKIKEYNDLVSDCRKQMENEAYTIDTFNLTTKILQWNPENYSIWNYRRILILKQTSAESIDIEKAQKTYVNELLFFMQLIKVNPKSYWLWNHRIWCLEAMPQPDWNAELLLVEKMLTMDARNFHGWNYRRFVVNHMRKIAKNEAEIAEIVKQEYEFTTKKINQSFSNYSAWHQRSKLLPEIVASMTEEEKNVVAVEELDLVKAAIYTDPEDQSAWLYYWWLLGRAPEQVDLSGAYQIQDTPLVILGFNDAIKFMQVPQFCDTNGQPLQGKLYAIDEHFDAERASIWVYLLDAVAVIKKISIQPNTILPSNSYKSLSLFDQPFEASVQTIMNNEGVCEQVKTKLGKSWTPLSTKMYKDPTLNDQTAWFTLDKTQLLKDEIETVRELLELEPESAWALQTLVHFLNQLVLRASNQVDSTAIYKEINSILDKLIEIDSDRQSRYKDTKTKIIFEQKTQSISDTESLDLSELPSSRISPLSRLLLVKDITVSSSDLQSLFHRLPLLNKCTISAI